MEKCFVTRRCVALWFGSVVPDSRGAAAAVRRALRCAGLKPWPETEAELFYRENGTLLIARPRPDAPVRANAAK